MRVTSRTARWWTLVFVKDDKVFPHAEREVYRRPHAPREEIVQPHTSREENGKPHAEREVYGRPHAPREENGRPHAPREDGEYRPMKAWRFHAFNDMRLDEIPEPVCTPGHVLVEPLCVQP